MCFEKLKDGFYINFYKKFLCKYKFVFNYDIIFGIWVVKVVFFLN